MDYILFSLWFIVIHTVAYTAAGFIALQLSKDLYEEKNRLLDYLRDMSVPEENSYVSKWFLPTQLVRGLLLSIVLYPILGFLGELSFALRFLFLAGLMFVYTDLAAAVPFSHNLEGFVYLKSRYVRRDILWKLYLEMVIYSLLFGAVAGWFLF